jgi:hypothetical protein
MAIHERADFLEYQKQQFSRRLAIGAEQTTKANRIQEPAYGPNLSGFSGILFTTTRSRFGAGYFSRANAKKNKLRFRSMPGQPVSLGWASPFEPTSRSLHGCG